MKKYYTIIHEEGRSLQGTYYDDLEMIGTIKNLISKNFENTTISEVAHTTKGIYLKDWCHCQNANEFVSLLSLDEVLDFVNGKVAFFEEETKSTLLFNVDAERKLLVFDNSDDLKLVKTLFGEKMESFEQAVVEEALAACGGPTALADHCGVSRQAVHGWKHGKREPSASAMWQMLRLVYKDDTRVVVAIYDTYILGHEFK